MVWAAKQQTIDFESGWWKQQHIELLRFDVRFKLKRTALVLFVQMERCAQNESIMKRANVNANYHTTYLGTNIWESLLVAGIILCKMVSSWAFQGFDCIWELQVLEGLRVTKTEEVCLKSITQKWEGKQLFWHFGFVHPHSLVQPRAILVLGKTV